MKTLILFFALCIAFSANSQSLKEALYSGKLKSDTGTVVRKTDDLSTKIDTTRKKPVEPEKPKAAPVQIDSATGMPVPVDSSATPATAAIKENTVASKDNNKIWKDYVEELTGLLRTEVLPNKKIKNGTYSLLIEYEIGVDGTIAVNSVSCSPESSFLEQQVKERITLTAPQMTPLLAANGKPRKAIKKQIITLSK